MSLLNKKCWYVKANGMNEYKAAFTYAEAILVADMLAYNGYKGIEIYRGQPQLNFDE